MTPIVLHPFIFWGIVVLFVMSIAGFGWILYLYMLSLAGDLVIFFDKTGRWTKCFMKLSGLDRFTYDEGKYFIDDSATILNKKGKGLLIYTKGKPTQMKITSNKAGWLDTESISAAVNNDLIKMMVKPTDSIKDTLMMFGALGGVLAGIASVLILLKQFGVI